MRSTNEELKNFYRGAYRFEETEDGYLKAFQYSKPQMEYFKKTFDFWYERSDASSSKTIEFITEATEISFDYKIVWKGSEDSVELWIDGLAFEILYVKDMENEGTITFQMPAGKKQAVVYLACDATVLIKILRQTGSFILWKNRKRFCGLEIPLRRGSDRFALPVLMSALPIGS